MQYVEEHRPGSFCWIELATTDQGAAKEFYSAVLGWSARDFPLGPDSYYTVFELEGRGAAAANALAPADRERGIPPHWMLYIASADADETAAKVTAAGGKIIDKPFDVFDLGRMCVCQDPTGAVFAVWEAARHRGLGIIDAAGSFCWADLSTNAPAEAAKFYAAVFGWEMDAGKDSGYLHIMNSGRPIGGIPPAQFRDPKTPAHWMLYFASDDVDATAARAGERGAQLLMKPSTIEMVGRMAIAADPQGAVFAIFKHVGSGTE